tara:strand:+ start:4701 stop:5723 length:1023 start_codon:yes stop_codon:yes gene_type:complete
MDWNAVTLLRTNINTLSLSIARNVKKTYPTRTTEFKKCTRDLAYILQATSTSIQANNTLAIDHIIKMFYLNGILRLHSTYAEIYAYDLMQKEIITLFEKHNITEHSVSIVKQCIELLKYALENGYAEYNSEWLSRRNYKVFDPTVPVPVDFQYRIETILENVPRQNCGHNNFDILKLQNSDLEIREFLVKHYFRNNKFNRFEAAILTSPLTYLCFSNLAADTYQPEYSLMSKEQSIAIHGGAILNECLSSGYDFSFIGCTEEPSSKISKRWIKMTQVRWNYNPSTEWPWPIYAFCIGRGIDYDPGAPREKEYTFQDGTTGLYELIRRPTSDVRKGNILYV